MLSVPRPRLTLSRRLESTALHFYQNRQLELYAAKETKRLTLRQLVFFGRSINEERIITSANYVRTELPVRIAHRLRDLQALPYIVVTQEGVAKVYELYWSAFEKFRRYPVVTSLAENEKFCQFVAQLLNEHATVIPNLYLGLSLSSPYLAPDQLDSFMRRMLISRISRRVLAEHHIALSEAYAGTRAQESRVGIISTALDVAGCIRRCTDLLKSRPLQDAKGWPQIVIDGHLDCKFAYIREHLEYIIFELLKNAVDATRHKHASSDSLPPINVTVAEGTDDVGIRVSDQGGGGLSNNSCPVKSPEDLFSFSHVRNATRLDDERLVALRTVSSSQEGLLATVREQVARWQQDGETDNIALQGSHPKIGIGLPMSNIFATYFGGSLELVSLDGWGTDVYLRVPKLGTNLEGIEV
ncbi:alpha-ketoacid dehydrogenase kinase [Armillaria gallica]|uniref:Protein-serine/threonine kinase n=1 Tax=Armillaria gallica TaxID=47427 RepID=A0A2H3EVD9_ARMGA|nr:alpha-ketoacid dehydrogenase kinase [Armillaria gallica]